MRTEILVIGSGAGGAITAATLAELGYEVLILEEGPGVDTAEIDSHSPAGIARLYRSAGLTPILGGRSIAFVEGCCVGGSTEVNSGFWHRLPDDAYSRWAATAQLGEFSPSGMEPYFKRIESELSVSLLGSTGEAPNSAVFRRGIEKLGWDYSEIPRCQKDPARSPFAPGAKQSMQRTYLPRAARAGATLRSNCQVTRILHEDGRASGVEISSGSGRSRRTDTIHARFVFVCAGAIQTPALLRRSRIRRNVGNRLHIHPMIKAAALFDESLQTEDAALPMYQVKQFGPTITLGGSVSTPGFLALTLLDNWDAGRRLIDRYDQTALFYAATRSMGRGSVRVVPGLRDGVVTRYAVSLADRRNLTEGLARLTELLFAAGASAVYPSVRSLGPLTSKRQAEALLREPLPASSMSLSAVHAFSTCPMGENPDLCATDSFGRVHGFGNLYVNDASLLPDPPGVNPQGPTMAVALRNAERFAEGAEPARRHFVASRASTSRADVLVTGAPGWLATRLVEILARSEDPEFPRPAGRHEEGRIRCLVQPSADESPLLLDTDQVELCRGDLTDPASLRHFCRGAEGATLFHVAGVIHPDRPSTFQRVNVDGTRHLIAAATAAGVRRLVAVSSNSVAGRNAHPDEVFDEASPLSPYMGYGRSKVRMEELVQRSFEAQELETVIIRVPWFYGPNQPPRQTLFFTMIKEGRFPILGDGSQKRSMAYIDNICQGLLRAAATDRAPGEIYWIADRRPYPMNEIVSTVRSVLQEEFGIACAERQMRLPGWIGDCARWADATLQAVGVYAQKVHVLGEMNQTIACSIRKAEAELGYSPRYDLREGMIESVRWCLANGRKI